MAQRVLSSNFCWLNTNMRDVDRICDIDTQPHDIVEVTHAKSGLTKKVGLIGLLTEDPTVYRPGAYGGATIEPVLACCETYLQHVLDPLALDLIVPVTHQKMPIDREFGKKFGGDRFPIVIGGHDHEPYDEVVSGSRIVKTGMDAENTALIDILWTIDDDGTCTHKPQIHVDMVPTMTYCPDPDIKKRVRGHERVLYELERANLFRFDQFVKDGEPFSTMNNRLGPTNGSSILCSLLRMGMRAQCCIINAGNIRGGKVYPKEQEWFRWSDLKAELPFPLHVSAIEIPGRVLEATIVYSRRAAFQDPPVSSGAYMQHCDQIEFDDTLRHIVRIRGQPFDPDQKYLTAIPTKFFSGMDNHVPLLEWAAENNIVVDEDEGGKMAKVLIVELFSALIWLKLGSFDTIDKDGDGVLTREEVRERSVSVFGEDVADLVVDNVFAVADLNAKGVITPLDMMVVQFVASDMLNHVADQEELSVMQKVASQVLGKRPSHFEVKTVVQNLKAVLDLDGDGKITRQEAMKVIGEVKRRSVLGE